MNIFWILRTNFEIENNFEKSQTNLEARTFYEIRYIFSILKVLNFLCNRNKFWIGEHFFPKQKILWKYEQNLNILNFFWEKEKKKKENKKNQEHFSKLWTKFCKCEHYFRNMNNFWQKEHFWKFWTIFELFEKLTKKK